MFTLKLFFTTFLIATALAAGVNFDPGSAGPKDSRLYYESLSINNAVNTTTATVTTAQSNVTSNVTIIAPTLMPAKNVTNSTDLTVGFISAGVAVLFFGSNFVPVKKFESGDGMFFQWIVVSAIWVVGLIVNMIRHVPTFHPLAMLGGFLWATGNVTVVPVIKTIGLGLGLCIWGSLNLLMGWTSGRFGWFGLKPEIPSNQLLNYLGVGFAVFRVIGFLLIKSDGTNLSESKVTAAGQLENNKTGHSDNQYDEFQSLLEKSIADQHVQVHGQQQSSPEIGSDDASWVDKLSPLWKRIVGCSLSVVAGCLYGLNFAPCIWIQDNVDGASKNGLDYVFAHFCGIYVTGTAYFIIYCIVMKNKPKIFPKLILPAMVSGGMWGIAQSAWFIANFTLEEAVSFPIITTGPGIIAALWGVLVFKEIKGKRNLIVLMISFVITITGAVLSGLSKLDNL
ncbi:transmembrane protein 144-like isoform X2 [Ptychodera flava]|uniref:transmembrane protein 144-like isoform X2 n=1 Tax=Ptychodera flava TaxID=63121 RepID=UPI00396A9D31